MSDSSEEQEKPSGGRGRRTVVIALTVGLLAGATAGSFVVGPLLADPPAAVLDEAACEGLFAEWEIEMRPPAPAAIHTIDNLVLNPAGSGGTRFLMASVGFGMRDLPAADQMVVRDLEIRDIVLRVLGSRTVGELTDMTVRNEIKEEMREQVTRLIGQRALIDIYFPQFVIQ